jgi:hypothetical protein
MLKNIAPVLNRGVGRSATDGVSECLLSINDPGDCLRGNVRNGAGH